MTPYYADESVTLYHGDCLDVLATLPDASVDSVVTDPPYGLEFMGQEWDAPWSESGINADAGFSTFRLADGSRRLPRPSFTGSTNPNCINCGDKRRGRRDGTALVAVCVCDAPEFPNVRATEMRAFGEWCEAWATECLRVLKPGGHLLAFGGTRTVHRLTCGIEDAGFEIRDGIDWLYGNGFPKSLNVSKAIDKAAGAEREVVGLSPHSRNRAASTFQADDTTHGYVGRAEGARTLTAAATDDARQWEGWGTALKPAREPIVLARKPLARTVAANVLACGTGALNIDGCRTEADQDYRDKCASVVGLDSNRNGDAYGEWTGVRDDSAHPAGRWPTNVVLSHDCPDRCKSGCPVGDLGQQSRFFPAFRYEAKAPTAERPRTADGTAHPTVKPLDLMRWLVRLVTPPGGTVLEPFAGSGTTAEACVIEGFRCLAIERDAKYLPLIDARLGKGLQPVLDLDVA